MDVSRDVTEFWKIWLASGGLILVIAWPWLKVKWRQTFLLALVLLSILNYGRWGPKTYLEKVDTYDLMHYYLNAKYFDELGYLDLYPAVILADVENDGPYYDQGNKYLAQLEETGEHAVRPISHALARGRHIRQTRFTEARWEAFEHDMLYMQREIKPRWPDRNWRMMIQDHGYNGTPAWTVIGKPLANLVPVESLKWLGYLDVVLIAAAVGSVAWAYGGLPALWVTFFLFVTYSTRWPTITWVFLRYDWICALIIATSLLRKGHHALAGVAAGYAALMRFFPAMWMWGPFSKGVAGLVRRTVNRPLVTLGVAFALTVGVGQGIATARLGADTVREHFVNMLDHNSASQLSSRRIGLALGLSHDGSYGPKWISDERKALIDRQKPLRYGVALLVLGVMGWGLRRSRDDEAFGFGFLPFFLLTTASYYYYVARATLVVIHAADLSKLRNRVGLALLLGLELFSNWAEVYHDGYRMFLISNLAWGLMLYTAVMMAWVLYEAREADRLEAERRISPASGAPAPSSGTGA